MFFEASISNWIVKLLTLLSYTCHWSTCFRTLASQPFFVSSRNAYVTRQKRLRGRLERAQSLTESIIPNQSALQKTNFGLKFSIHKHFETVSYLSRPKRGLFKLRIQYPSDTFILIFSSSWFPKLLSFSGIFSDENFGNFGVY